MRLIIVNKTASPLSYLGGAVVVPALSTLDVANTYWFALAGNEFLRNDLSVGNADLDDGQNNYGGSDAIAYLERFFGVMRDVLSNGITSTTVGPRQAVDVFIASGSTIGNPDSSAFLYGSSVMSPVGGVYNDVGAAVPSGSNAAFRITEFRAIHSNLRNAAGTEIGTASNPIRTDPTGTTVQPTSVNNLPTTVDTNYGTVGASTIRTASQIGNATGAADFNIGATGAQTLRVVANIARDGNPLDYNFGAASGNTLRTAALLGNATGAADFNAGAVSAQTLRVIIANNQSAIPISNFPTTVDTNYGTVSANTLRTASQIGNATGAADFNVGATGAQTLRVVANQGAPNTSTNGWPVKITDGTDNALVTPTGDVQVNDFANTSCVYGPKSVTGTATLMNVSGSNLANRKEISVYNNSIVTLYYGFDSSVTTSNGTPVPPGAMLILKIGPAVNLYMIAAAGTNNTRVTELS